MNILPMQNRHMQEISLWQYDGEYAFYNAREPFICSDPDAPVEDTTFVCLDENGRVAAHFHYGEDGRIPTVENYAYTDDWLDVGLGLRPDLCGKGLGGEFVLDYAEKLYGPTRFRLSVAAFNERAIKVYERAGFTKECEVTNSYFGNKFWIMKRGEVQRTRKNVRIKQETVKLQKRGLQNDMLESISQIQTYRPHRAQEHWDL